MLHTVQKKGENLRGNGELKALTLSLQRIWIARECGVAAYYGIDTHIMSSERNADQRMRNIVVIYLFLPIITKSPRARTARYY